MMHKIDKNIIANTLLHFTSMQKNAQYYKNK